MHDLALAQILQERPQVVPSFHRLNRPFQKLIIDCLSVDFQFNQFLQAEATPANLNVMREKLIPHGNEGFAFFCFRIFAQMCGKLGSESLKCSLFMDESQFQRFRPGLDALQELTTKHDVAAAYNSFLLLRGCKAMSRFASPEHQGLARLLCLCAAYDHEGGRSVCDAFDRLEPGERRDLTQWLNKDGISQLPGYVLCDAPRLLQSAMNANTNETVGLVAAMRLLIRVFQKLASEQEHHTCSNVVVRLGELADLVKDFGPQHEEEFSQASFSLQSDRQGESHVITVRVGPSSNVESPRSRSESIVIVEPSRVVQSPSARELAVATLLLLALVLVASSSRHSMLARFLLGMSFVALVIAVVRCLLS